MNIAVVVEVYHVWYTSETLQTKSFQKDGNLVRSAFRSAVRCTHDGHTCKRMYGWRSGVRRAG